MDVPYIFTFTILAQRKQKQEYKCAVIVVQLIKCMFIAQLYFFPLNFKHLQFTHRLESVAYLFFFSNAEVIAAGHSNAAHLTVGKSGMRAKSLSAVFFSLPPPPSLPFGDNIN